MAEAEFVNLDPGLRPHQTRKYFKTRRRVLILEDDRLMGQMLTMILDDMGFEITMANNGITAFAMLQQQQLDFIILDVLLAEAAGFEICSSLRLNPATKDIPLLVITSRPDEKNIEQALQLGIHHFLSKPFTEDELLQEILILLRDHSQ
ncbi:MAG: response regulator [Anaerolineae bacterium]|nr:response regulator [Anaerolineae bacterium]